MKTKDKNSTISNNEGNLNQQQKYPHLETLHPNQSFICPPLKQLARPLLLSTTHSFTAGKSQPLLS